MDYPQIKEIIENWRQHYAKHPTINFDSEQRHFGAPTTLHLATYRKRTYTSGLNRTDNIRLRASWPGYDGRWNGPAAPEYLYTRCDPFLASLQLQPLQRHAPLLAPLIVAAPESTSNARFDPEVPFVYYKIRSYYKFLFWGDTGYRLLQHYLDFWETDPACRKALLLPPLE